MFHLRLALVIIVSFGFVLFLGVALYWGSNQVVLYFQRCQIAYETFDEYERLSQEAYRHFKQHMDRVINKTAIAEADVEISKNRLYEAMDDLRNTSIKTQIRGDHTERWQDKRAELQRVAYLTAFLESGEYRFKEVEKLYQQGKREQAIQALYKFSKEEIDGKFQPLIDAAITAEREKARITQGELESLIRKSRWIATLTALSATIFSLTSVILLLRGVRKPIAALMKGTDQIATGNLNYRINLDTGDEFAYLATHFNQMAQELGHQQYKLREGRALLENKVAERTAKLNQLNEELQQMDVARREFLADISHELRTPITVIRGEAEVTLREDTHDIEVYKDALQRIVDLSMQLGKYVNDLLFLARAETANMQFEWRNLNLTQLVINSVEDFHVLAQENSISVSLDATREAIWVRGDKQRLRQVLFILGDNACRYSNPGEHIAVSLWREGNVAKLKVEDHGIGIPNEDLERIFDRNFRSKNARRSRQDGSGLGLPVAKAILVAHSGRIEVASNENYGSTFTLTLPLISANQDKLSYE